LPTALSESAVMTALTFERVSSSPYSLGMICEFVARFPPFNDFEFGVVVKTLLYQLESASHLAAGLDDRLVGYVGWISTTREIAEAWLDRDAQLRPAFENADTLAVTILAAEEPSYIAPLIREAKVRHPGHSVFWKRYYTDGRLPAKRRVIKRTA
jgi:hypothetical protein